MKKVNICIVGIGPFARPFIRCYQRHPLVGEVFICARNPERIRQTAASLNIDEEHCFTDFEKMLQNDRIDAVHLITPTFDHAEQEVAVLKAGKHLATAVAMGETIEQLKEIVHAQHESGKNFMLMETSAYSRDILKAKKMIENGEMGRVQFISGSHMENYRTLNYEARWNGYPPFMYCSHACVPLYVLTNKLAESVICLGSGDIGEELTKNYGCKDSYQTCLVTLKDSDVKGEFHRSIWDSVRQEREHFDVYGTKLSYEWEQCWGEGAVIHTGNQTAHREIAEDVTEGLPESLIYDGEKSPVHTWHFSSVDTLEYALRLGHNGAYPHLIHEFISSIVEGREAYLNAEVAANITAIGLCAVESARRNGEKIQIPDFSAC